MGLYANKVPAWAAEQATWKGRLTGAKGSDVAECYTLAVATYGKSAQEADSGLVAFAYLWRRFGPPFKGSDPDKELCSYVLRTPQPGVYLEVSPKGYPLAYAIGYLITPKVDALTRKPLVDWWTAYDRWAKRKGLPAFWSEDGEKREAGLRRAVKELGPIPKRVRPGPKAPGLVGRINRALVAAMRELLRPVCVRDVPINLFGRCADAGHAAKPYRLAGYGVPREAMEAAAKGDG
jgi:hypothetical protein